MSDLKHCKWCSRWKSRCLFYRQTKSRDGLQYRCKSCQDVLTRGWAKRNPEHYRKTRLEYERRSRANFRVYIWKNYGITLDEWDDLVRVQDHCCAICGLRMKDGDRRFHVDHDHSTNEIRGLLCFSCNAGLGNFRESVEALQQAIRYLGDPPVRMPMRVGPERRQAMNHATGELKPLPPQAIANLRLKVIR